MAGDDGLLDGVPLDGVHHALDKKKLEREEDKKFITEQSFFNNADAPRKRTTLKTDCKIDKPKVVLMHFDKRDWPRAFVARLHNTIRKEIVDMFVMMECFYADPMQVRPYHVGLFFDWWDHFSSFMFTEFEGEQEVVYQALRRKGVELPECMKPERLRPYAAQLQDLVASISESRRGAENRPPIEPLNKCLKAMKGFPVILDFLQEVDKFLPDLLSDHFTSRDGIALEQELLTFLNRNGEIWKYHVWIMLNKMDHSDVSQYKKVYCPLKVRLNVTNQAAKFKVHHIRPLHEIVSSLGEKVTTVPPELHKSPLVSPRATKTNVLTSKEKQ
eukprot:Plantae.Rhodophyta-Rhodochaete_pulchella.ctg235.p2 GENE.Plantae.Rhodophyta-Rhodochaete_pulchella.ctg235~~Plantae.Rhodophyta-Rhodochaete_pulchella.ctg235.p2  ORF type:complete len:329 (-),score=60.89 Plantae.Rhodophyta-Rhodochaete_pulchella.ctg235:884-1870(-)